MPHTTFYRGVHQHALLHRPTRVYTPIQLASAGPQILELQNVLAVDDAVDTLGDYAAGGGLVEDHAVLQL